MQTKYEIDDAFLKAIEESDNAEIVRSDDNEVHS